MTEETTRDEEFLCPLCKSPLPAERRESLWCECGWKMPPNMVARLHEVSKSWERAQQQEETPGDKEYFCPLCKTSLPAERRKLPWCECGWNLPSDPVERMRGRRRSWGRLSRRLGDIQARQDARWMSRQTPIRRIGWWLLTAMMHLLAPIPLLLRLGLLLALSFISVVAIMVWQGGCVVSVVLLALVAVAAHHYRPINLPDLRRRRALSIDLPQERVLETVTAVATRLGVTPPSMLSLTPFPILQVDMGIQWTFPPRLVRRLTVGLPVLATLNISEFRAATGHAMAFTSGGAVWFLPAALGVLQWCWKAMNWVLDNALDSLALTVIYMSPFVACLLLSIVVGQDIFVPLTIVGIGVRFVGIFGLSCLAILLPATMIVWLAARWNRRHTLLVDQLVAKEYGRNVLLQTLPKLWVMQRWFDKQWSNMVKNANKEPPKANLYLQFRDRWAGVPEPLKEKMHYGVTVGFRSLFSYVPVFSDRRELLAQIRARFLDDKPAAQLLPHITEIGGQMTLDMLSRDRKNGKEE